jgi:hypothetical protein
VEVLVIDVMVWLTVKVVVPAARASSPLRNMRAPPEGAQVTVVFFVVICVDVVDRTVVLGLGVTVLTTRAPESEIVLVLLTPFCVFVMYEVCVWPWSFVIVTAFGVIVETTWTVVVALTTTGFGEYVEVETMTSVVLIVDGFPWAVAVARMVCVNLEVTVLSAWVMTLDTTEVALTTDVFKTGDGVNVAPSVPASTCVEVLVTAGLVALMVVACFSVKVFVV